MVEFNKDIPKGLPQLDQNYWSRNVNSENQNSVLDANTNFALKDLEDISIFKGKKK